MSGLAARWTEVLDRIEHDVATAQTALQAGTPVELESWQAPAEDLGAVPADLRPRAETIAGRLVDVQQRCRRDLSSLHAELGHVDRRRDAGTAYASSSVRHRDRRG